MGATGNALKRRIRNPEYAECYFVGDGIDIGAGTDSLWLYREHFPKITSVRDWDMQDGDASDLDGLADNSFDFAYSSHCIEHIEMAFGMAMRALERMIDVCRSGGFVVVAVPDFGLYEHGHWPSHYNADHKWHIDMNLLVSIILPPLLRRTELISVQLLHDCWTYPTDKDYTPMGQEAGIEFVLRKRVD